MRGLKLNSFFNHPLKIETANIYFMTFYFYDSQTFIRSRTSNETNNLGIFYFYDYNNRLMNYLDLD